MSKGKERFEKHLRKFEGKEVQIKVQRPKSTRSLNQNNYYWGCVVDLVMKEMGDLTKAETHVLLGSLFLKVGLDVKGKRYEGVRSTTDLSTVEFEEYLEQIRRWASVELHLSVPLPNEVDWGYVILRTTQ